MSPLLSVVVPFFNVERYLGECLDSISGQTLDDLECILVDDGSADGSARVAGEFAGRDRRFRLVRGDNQGVGPARNWGASLARGRYLTFVDSDDLVPPRAFSLLTAVLQQTGSSFAAGNARRFGGPQGVTQSWTHSIPFARTRLATHIDMHPQLIRDRMLWNKVYRRDFWEEAGLTFPAMRYEDFPVSMRAHLEAASVDVVSDHVYYWRERESGDSITQTLFQLDNMVDRVRSAEWTLDIVRQAGTQAAIRLINEYFIDTDLVALARGLIHGAPADVSEIQTLGRDLAQRVPLLRRSSHPLADIIHEAYLRDDVAMVRAMARWRDGEGVRGLRTELPTVLRPAHLRPVARRAVPRRRLQNPRAPRRLRSSLVSMSTVGPRTTLVVDVRLRPQIAHRATVSAALAGMSPAIPLVHGQTPTATGLRLEICVDSAEFEALGTPWQDARVRITLRAARLTWQGSVDANPVLLAGPVLSSHSAYQWTAPRGHTLGVRRLDAVHLASAETRGHAFVLHHPSMVDPQLSVLRPYPTPPARFRTEGQTSVIDLDQLLDDPPDEPVTGVTERSVVVDRLTGPLRLLLLGDPVTLECDDRRAEITRDSRGDMVLRLSPADLGSELSAAAVAEVEDHDAEGGSPPPELGVGDAVADEPLVAADEPLVAADQDTSARTDPIT